MEFSGSMNDTGNSFGILKVWPEQIYMATASLIGVCQTCGSGGELRLPNVT